MSGAEGDAGRAARPTARRLMTDAVEKVGREIRTTQQSNREGMQFKSSLRQRPGFWIKVARRRDQNLFSTVATHLRHRLCSAPVERKDST
jgi:hypothetical protein